MTLRTTMLAAALVATGLSTTAHANMEADCRQTADQQAKIDGCTAVIASGKYPGKGAVWAFNNRGIALSAQRKHTQAIKDYDEALRLDPSYAPGYYNRGLSYQRLGKRDRAIDDYSQAILFKPDYGEAFGNRGNVYLALMQYRRAIEDYDQAIRIGTRAPVLDYANRGNAFQQMAQPDKAMADWEKAIELGGADEVTWWQRRLERAGLPSGSAKGLYNADVERSLRICAANPKC